MCGSTRFQVAVSGSTVFIRRLNAGRLVWERYLSLEEFMDLLGEMQYAYLRLVEVATHEPAEA